MHIEQTEQTEQLEGVLSAVVNVSVQWLDGICLVCVEEAGMVCLDCTGNAGLVWSCDLCCLMCMYSPW